MVSRQAEGTHMLALLNGRAALVGALTLVGFLLCACAPPTSTPPPMPMADGQIRELGFALSGGSYIYHTVYCPENPYAECRKDTDLWPAIDGQAWYRRARNRWEHGFTASAGNSSTSLGGFARVRMNQSETSYVGLQVDAGLLWASFGVPMSGQLREGLWIYTNPSFGLRFTGPLYVPIGINKTFDERNTLNVELLYRGEFGNLSSLGYVEAPILTASAGLSRQF